jgi:hypothetical protein
VGLPDARRKRHNSGRSLLCGTLKRFSLMEIRDFAEKHADEALARCLVRAIDNAESNSQPTTLAHVLDSLLQEKAVEDRF